MSLQEKFETISKEVAAFKTIDDDQLFATFYSLFKQATVGDCTAAGPDGTDSRSVAKYNAWAKLKGTSKEKAMETYIHKYDENKDKYKK